ncbi:MAG TPA: HU family DNA-binding protein [Alphaproteobacteria bacterium]
MARTKTAKPARAKRATKAAKPRKAARAKPARAMTAARKAAPKAKARRPVARRAAPRAAVRVGATPMGKSDKDHLAAVIQGSTGCTAKIAKDALDNVISTITESLKKKGKVQLTGFGSFAVTRRAARMGRNPRTGEKVKIKASRSVRFRAGKTLKDAV